MFHFVTDCQLALGISASVLNSLENIAESWHKLDFRGIYVDLLISCQEKASGDFGILQIMPWIQNSVKSNYDDNVQSKLVLP